MAWRKKITEYHCINESSQIKPEYVTSFNKGQVILLKEEALI